MELSVGFVLDSGVGGVGEGEDGVRRNVVDDVAFGEGVGGVVDGADVAGEVDVGDDAFAVLEPDGHEELHVPAGVAYTVAVYFVEAVAPVFAFKDAASVSAQGA